MSKLRPEDIVEALNNTVVANSRGFKLVYMHDSSWRGYHLVSPLGNRIASEGSMLKACKMFNEAVSFCEN